VWIIGRSLHPAEARGQNVHVIHRERPILLYDGDCAFCTSCARLLERIGPDASIVPWQSTDLTGLGISEQQANDAVQWAAIDGTIGSGHEAIAAILNTAGPIWKTIGRVILLPGISWMAAKVYRLVSQNRQRLPGGTPACARAPVRASGVPPEAD
jgi:predicted DCC family thiol-disulfide oxidoreductase YuxK